MRHSFPQGKTGRTGLQIVRYFCCSVAQLCPLQPHWLQLARFLCPSLSLRICSNSRESMMPFSHLILCCPLLLPSIFPSIKVMSRLFAPGGQSTGASVLSMNIQGWFPLGLTCLISLQSRKLSRVFSNTIVQNSLVVIFLYGPTLTSIHDYWKNHSID